MDAEYFRAQRQKAIDAGLVPGKRSPQAAFNHVNRLAAMRPPKARTETGPHQVTPPPWMQHNPHAPVTIATSALAALAELAGLLPCGQAGFTTHQGRPVEPLALEWFMRGAYGFDIPERESSAVIQCGRLMAVERATRRDLAAIRRALDDDRPNLVDRVAAARLALRGMQAER